MLGCLVAVAVPCWAGCGPKVQATTVKLPPPINVYTLGPGDRFEFLVIGEDKFPKEYTISVDGTVDFPMLHRQNVVGFEAHDLATHVRNLLIEGKFLRDPVVIVNIKEYNSKRVTVGGAVTRPGDVPFQPNLTLMRAVTGAGGFTQQANRSAVTITRRAPTGEKVTARFATDDIAEGRTSDIPLQAGDTIYVYERNF